MIAIKTNKSIVCDVNGCGKPAVYFVKNDSSENDYYSLKLCKECAKELKTVLTEVLKKEKVNEKQG